MWLIKDFFKKVIFVIKKILKGILKIYVLFFILSLISLLFSGDTVLVFDSFSIISFFILCIIGYYLYVIFYYRSEKFLYIKNSISKNTEDCNNLNKHIEELKNSYINIKKLDYGASDYIDASNWNYRRKELNKNYDENVYNCSRTVCSNSSNQPFKYMCKYFNIDISEETLENFESVLNNFSAAEQGKVLLKKERERILQSVSKDIHFLIRKMDKKRLVKKLGFDGIVNFNDLYFPKYIFKYISLVVMFYGKCYYFRY